MKRAGPSSGSCSRTTKSQGLYIHVPFCLRKCPYCSFVSVEARSDLLTRWFDALLEETATALLPGAAITTLYAGGGSPSLIAPGRWRTFFRKLAMQVDLTGLAESTIEVNPATSSFGDIEGYREAGFDRISIGIQSFGKRELTLLGRLHTVEQAEETYNFARRAGFSSIGIDLIYGIPGQTVEDWERSLIKASSMRPEHISCYELTVDTETPFGELRSEGKLMKPDEDTCAEMYFHAHQALTDAGYSHYEVSSYALGGENRSKHNSGYWNRTPYTGLGPSAHSFDGADLRWWNTSDIESYLESLESCETPVLGSELLTAEQQVHELVMLGMRHTGGFDLEDLQRFGALLACEGDTLLDRLSSEGHLTREDTRIRPSASGMLLADGIALELCQSLTFESRD